MGFGRAFDERFDFGFFEVSVDRVWFLRSMDIWSLLDPAVLLAEIHHCAKMHELSPNRPICFACCPTGFDIVLTGFPFDQIWQKIAEMLSKSFPCMFHGLENCFALVLLLILISEPFNRDLRGYSQDVFNLS